MNLVFLAPFGIRPKGTVLARMVPLAAELRQLGHEVTIVAPPYTNPEDSGKTGTVRGVRIVNVLLPGGAKPIGAPLVALRMWRAAMAGRPDLVHLFKPKGYGGLAAMLHLGLRQAGVRLPPLFVDTDDWEGKGGMNSLHGYPGPEARLFAFQEGWIPPRAAGVTVASRTLQAQVWGMGVSPERVLYLPNCVDDVAPGDGARGRRKAGIAPDEPTVLLYTRFFEFSQGRLHEVLAGISARVSGVRFLVVGKGRGGEEELLRKVAQERGFLSSLAPVGWVEPEEIPDYLAAADVALYPFDDTLVNRAKCPAKLTEIICAAVPVVADRVGQVAEYLLHGETGLLTAPDDPLAMVDAAVRLLSDPELRGAMGARGRARLLECFNWRSAASELTMFYRKLVNQ